MEKATYTVQVLEAEATLYRVAKSILKNDADCADAVQEAILKSYSKLHTLKEDAFFKTWMVRILINECYKIQKLRKKVLPYEEYQREERTAEEYSHSDLYEALLKLDEKLRIPIILYYINGFKINEVAKVLKVPEGTVKSRLSRGRSMLRNTLHE